MAITINPIFADRDTQMSIAGEAFTIDGTAYDLSSVPEGGVATPTGDHPFKGPITRTNGELYFTVNWPFDAATAVEDLPLEYPTAPITDGPVSDPIPRKGVSA